MANQTPEQRDRVLEHVGQQGDGYIFCLDLRHAEGQKAAEQLRAYPDVAAAWAVRDAVTDCRYMLVLMPFSHGGRAITMFAASESVTSAAEQIHNRSRDFGTIFALVIAPPDAAIADCFVRLMDSAGSA